MSAMLTIQSRSHPYTVETFGSLGEALGAVPAASAGTLCLADRAVHALYRGEFERWLPPERILLIEASEEAKSFEALAPVFTWLLRRGLKRDGCLVIVGGGVLQDIGCFAASVLLRGVRWELLPTTLLAQCDSCIGSKSSLNLQSFKNQIGTFYPPHRVLLAHGVLKTLPWDEIRSGLGEVIKLHLLAGEQPFAELMDSLAALPGDDSMLPRWVLSSLRIKQTYIEQDEFDRGIRNLLNYGHTFGHAYESATHYEIPHGIAVTLGMLTATWVSTRLGLVNASHYAAMKDRLRPWHEPYGARLKSVELPAILDAIKLDKKATRSALNCILTRGNGRMEKISVDLEGQLRPALSELIAREI
jgi:3-dehydroquinate synthase